MSICEEDSCPLCLEAMDATDKAVRYCPCGYPLCLWCFNTLEETARTQSLPARCPACRAEYKEKVYVGTDV